MKEPEYTRGPWIFRLCTPSTPHFEIGPSDEDGRVDAGLSVAATISGYAPDAVEIARANARLIAASPELLEALSEAEALIARNAYPCPDKPDSPWGVLYRVRAAIRKATGEVRS